ncbi:MAG: ECF-type sigma factor [Aeoliella sp.]
MTPPCQPLEPRRYAGHMSDVTQILHKIEQGDPRASDELLPIIYAELRSLAASKLANEKSGQTLQPTALVHEAYMRLVGGPSEQDWDSRGHFFAAAAEAMRRILVDKAREKNAQKRGAGKMRRVELEEGAALTSEPTIDDRLVALDLALDRLEKHDKTKAELVLGKKTSIGGNTDETRSQRVGLTQRYASPHFSEEQFIDICRSHQRAAWRAT